MFRQTIENRNFVSVFFAASIWMIGWFRYPFPQDNDVLELVHLVKPEIYQAIRWTYFTLWFSTPWLVCSIALSLVYIFVAKHEKGAQGDLPPYPAQGAMLELVLGEIHQQKKPEPSAHPSWLTIPERGLYTGITVIGAIGSGKTSCCMHPFAEQILSFASHDPEKRIGGLVLEVKGDFCQKVRQIMKKHGREQDFLEMSVDSRYRYNPLHNELEAYALAYGIASLLNNLYGHGKEPFWQQAYTNLVKFIILLHKVLYGYVTLFDVYECAINPDLLAERIKEGQAKFGKTESVLLTLDAYVDHQDDLAAFGFKPDPESRRMRAPLSEDVIGHLRISKIAYEIQTSEALIETADEEDKRDQYEAVRRWFTNDWRRIEPKLRTSIVEGVSVFLSLFDDNPAVKRTFCPPKECYDARANPDGRFGVPLPPFSDLIEKGIVCALNFPLSLNPGLAKAIGTFMKLDFERAVLNRIPAIESQPDRHHRQVLFLCDEYHAFATVGENDPSGDEKFFSLSRQAKCIPIVATQSISSLRSALPGESWRALLQTFRTKIFLSLSDDFSTKVASDLCGKEEQLRQHYGISESGMDAGINLMTGKSTARRSYVSTSKGYSVMRDMVFEPKVFAELQNAQAIVLAYDGFNPMPPCYCYLKPYYLDPNKSYFKQLAAGEI